MELGFIGLGQMGGNMVRRLSKAGASMYVHSANQTDEGRRWQRSRHSQLCRHRVFGRSFGSASCSLADGFRR